MAAGRICVGELKPCRASPEKTTDTVCREQDRVHSDRPLFWNGDEEENERAKGFQCFRSPVRPTEPRNTARVAT
jgi:hypothetical protein